MPRKKEADLIKKNKAKILEAAKELFLEVGVSQPQMSEIAKKAGMSKSTLYVYFRSKEEIINYITKEAMDKLYGQFVMVQGMKITDEHEQYMKICFALVEFREKYPLSFETLAQRINIDTKELEENHVLMEIYQTGEKINQLILGLLTREKKDMNIQALFQLIFTQWGSIYGLIMMANNKQEYIQSAMNITVQQFLEQGFEQHYLILQHGMTILSKGDRI